MEYQSASSATEHYSPFYSEEIKMNGNKICCCCLSNNNKMVGLQYCTHADFFLQNFPQMDLSRKTVCLLCHNMLEKINIFQKQIIDSTTILLDQLPHILPRKLHNLRISGIKTTSKSEFEDEMNTEEITFKSELEPTTSSLTFVTEVKIEHNSSSENENDSPLCNTYTIEEDIKDDGKKKKPKQSNEDDDKYKGKILIYNLTRDELDEEREMEAKKATYLKLPYKCESCIKGFDHEITLIKHNDKQHRQKKGGIQCDVCKTILAPLSHKEHMRRHYRRLQCVICGKRTHDIYSISHHFNQEHSQAGLIPHEFQCTDCDFTCSSNRAYRYHRDKHKQKSQCTKCGNTYVNATTLRVHMLNVHDERTAKYKCSQCDKSYCSKSGLFSHQSSAHSDSGSFCAECKTHFRTKHGLAHHLNTHSKHVHVDRKRFECADCDAKFIRKSSLQEHIDWTHLKNVVHQCSQCDKVFKSAKSLRKHIGYVHEKKRPPRDKICDYCGRGFTTIPILRNHIRTHTGERPLACPLCDATFAQSACLYTHTKLVHKQSIAISKH